jgi:hypothetical protein
MNKLRDTNFNMTISCTARASVCVLHNFAIVSWYGTSSGLTQFPKHRNFNCSYFIVWTMEKVQKPIASQHFAPSSKPLKFTLRFVMTQFALWLTADGVQTLTQFCRIFTADEVQTLTQLCRILLGASQLLVYQWIFCLYGFRIFVVVTEARMEYVEPVWYAACLWNTFI